MSKTNRIGLALFLIGLLALTASRDMVDVVVNLFLAAAGLCLFIWEGES